MLGFVEDAGKFVEVLGQALWGLLSVWWCAECGVGGGVGDGGLCEGEDGSVVVWVEVKVKDALPGGVSFET